MSAEVVVDNPERLGAALVARFEDEARRAHEARGRFAVALPGGSVASTFFPRLAEARVDWTRTDFFWGDERAVPPGDPGSNYGLARALWLDPARVPPERVHRVEAEASDLARVAEEYERLLLSILGAPPRLDLALLGVGTDGHVASLFPGHPTLTDQRRWVAAVEDAPRPPARRVTLTLPTLAAARLVIIAAFGAAKAAAIAAALEDPATPLPVGLLSRRAPQVSWLIDHAAASTLDGDPRRLR
jgi:6-phosphogluconolactonase